MMLVHALSFRAVQSISSRSRREFALFASSRPTSFFVPQQLPGAHCRAATTRRRTAHFNSVPSNEIEEHQQHRKSYRITGTGRASSVTAKTCTGHKLQTDVPKKMGGTDGAPQPVEHLLAALLGCSQATAVFVGRSMNPRVLIDRIEFDVEAFRDERGALQQPINEFPDVPARLQRVSGRAKIFLKGKKNHLKVMSEEQLEMLAQQTEARCPVANMMEASGCTMDIQWVDGSITE